VAGDFEKETESLRAHTSSTSQSFSQNGGKKRKRSAPTFTNKYQFKFPKVSVQQTHRFDLIARLFRIRLHCFCDENMQRIVCAARGLTLHSCGTQILSRGLPFHTARIPNIYMLGSILQHCALETNRFCVFTNSNFGVPALTARNQAVEVHQSAGTWTSPANESIIRHPPAFPCFSCAKPSSRAPARRVGRLHPRLCFLPTAATRACFTFSKPKRSWRAGRAVVTGSGQPRA